MWESGFLLFLVTLVAVANETFTGFAGTIITITLGANFLPLGQLVPAWVVVNLALNLYIVLRHRDQVAWGRLFRQIFPAMSLGIVTGAAVYPWVQDWDLKQFLGGMVVLFAGRELLLALRRRGPARRPLAAWQAHLWQYLAGVVHAIYATGGPFLVYSMGGQDLPKSRFRSTICAVWVTCNLVLVTTFLFSHRLTSETLHLSGYMALAIVPGILGGQFLHEKADELVFRRIVYGLLVLAGAVLIFPR
ncbi:MAG: sulfite exporter TauE/SafE family protein [Deltaproteobacteria bacterium]|nr:sulfite exporter TauE/SafE family protein [Deltaproteobacteria bacterium]